jgi:hypothetical protein
MLKVALLRFVAVTLLVGGTVRIFATRALFEAFGMGDLWMQSPYSLYIYRVLGGFVVLSGIVIMVVSDAPGTYRKLLLGTAIGFAVIGAVMLASGLTSGLPVRFYLADPIYCLFIVVVLSYSSR